MDIRLCELTITENIRGFYHLFVYTWNDIEIYRIYWKIQDND